MKNKKCNYFPFLFILFLLFSCNQNSGEFNNSKSHEELLYDAKTIEIENPLDYLSLKYDLDYKLLSGKVVFIGNIKSTASKAIFKDIRLEIEFYSKTNSHLGSENYVIYEYVKPNESIPFEIKVKAPKGTEIVDCKIVDADLGD